jgi:hypothetical protein
VGGGTGAGAEALGAQGDAEELEAMGGGLGELAGGLQAGEVEAVGAAG